MLRKKRRSKHTKHPCKWGCVVHPSGPYSNMTVQWQSLTDLILEMGDVKNPSTMEGNFSHSLKQLFNVHTLDIRHLFLGKGRIDAHSVMDICGIHLFSPHNHPKNDGWKATCGSHVAQRMVTCRHWWFLIATCPQKDFRKKIPGLILLEDRFFLEILRTQDQFCWKIFFFWKILGHRNVPMLKPSGISPIKVRKNDPNTSSQKNLSSPFRSASGGVKWTIDHPLQLAISTHQKWKTGYSPPKNNSKGTWKWMVGIRSFPAYFQGWTSFC